jgi:hypothetical protein
LAHLGYLAFQRNELPAAIRLVHEGLVTAAAARDPYATAWAAACMGVIDVALDDLSGAQERVEQVLALSDDRGLRGFAAEALLAVATALERRGEQPAALSAYRRSREIFELLGEREKVDSVDMALSGAKESESGEEVVGK